MNQELYTELVQSLMILRDIPPWDVHDKYQYNESVELWLHAGEDTIDEQYAAIEYVAKLQTQWSQVRDKFIGDTA